MTLGDELLPAGDEEAIRELFNDCAQDKNAYLVDGAILTCNMAYTQPQALRSVLYGTELKNGEKNVSQTLLKIPETNSYINGIPVAIVKDHVIDTNIEPFKCNCLNIPDRKRNGHRVLP